MLHMHKLLVVHHPKAKKPACSGLGGPLGHGHVAVIPPYEDGTIS
jgi:hypothetical protein